MKPRSSAHVPATCLKRSEIQWPWLTFNAPSLFQPERFLQFRTLLHKTAKIITHPDSPETNLPQMLQLVQLNVDSERARGEFDPQLKKPADRRVRYFEPWTDFDSLRLDNGDFLMICTYLIYLEKTMELRASSYKIYKHVGQSCHLPDVSFNFFGFQCVLG